MNKNTNQTPAPSASRHTPEPWQAIKWTSHAEATIAKLNSDRELVTVIGDCTGHGECSDLGIANAARIVACVNALAGMEPGAVAALVAAAEAAVEHANKRQKLATSGLLDEEMHRLPEPKFVEMLRSALAALKGGAK